MKIVHYSDIVRKKVARKAVDKISSSIIMIFGMVQNSEMLAVRMKVIFVTAEHFTSLCS